MICPWQVVCDIFTICCLCSSLYSKVRSPFIICVSNIWICVMMHVLPAIQPKVWSSVSLVWQKNLVSDVVCKCFFILVHPPRVMSTVQLCWFTLLFRWSLGWPRVSGQQKVKLTWFIFSLSSQLMSMKSKAALKWSCLNSLVPLWNETYGNEGK